MVTKNGKFEPNVSICLTISEHHPESWDPVWTVRALVVGFISFFISDESTGVGLCRIPMKQKARIELAKSSKGTLLKNKKFIELFSSIYKNIGLKDHV